MRKEITLYEVETLQDVRLNGAEVAAGKIVSVTEQIKNIWLSKGICKLPDQVQPETPETPEKIKGDFPQKIENGLYLLSDGTEFKGGKQKAIEAENALKG